MDERRAEVGGIEIFWREAPTTDGGAPVVYVHGVPTNSDDWLPFLERTGGLALDLPGFGRSGKPADFPYVDRGLRGLPRRAGCAEAGVDRYRLVVHDWGAVGLALAQRAPERVERLVVINAVPFLPGYRWHRVARVWRTPLAGEMFMGFTFKWNLRRVAAAGRPGSSVARRVHRLDLGALRPRHPARDPQALPLGAARRAGRRRRAAGRDRRARARRLGRRREPYLPPEFAQRYADALGGPAQVERLEDARHWPWVGRPETVDLVAGLPARMSERAPGASRRWRRRR